MDPNEDSPNSSDYESAQSHFTGGSGGNSDDGLESTAPNLANDPSIQQLARAFTGESWQVSSRRGSETVALQDRADQQGFDVLRWRGQAWEVVSDEGRRNQILSGSAFLLQAGGLLANNTQTYAAGVAAGGAQGLNTILTAAWNRWQIQRHPDQSHQNPNYWQAAVALANMAGQIAYGSLTPSNPQASGYGAAIAGVAYMASGVVPSAGLYQPSPDQQQAPRQHDLESGARSNASVASAAGQGSARSSEHRERRNSAQTSGHSSGQGGERRRGRR
ncbi:hypothetical protein [Micromonospora sp. DT229]|uniref:hypothetical protein n=1 Tax=Micromonospora sp. DT229 TaxID=3393430 RepID=UPI003CF87240